MIVVVGESLIDVVPRRTSRGSTALEYDEHVGGGPLNIAVGIARLDADSLLVTQTGTDERGRRVRETLARNGVECLDHPTSTGRTNTATATLDNGGTANYDFDLEWTLPGLELPPCDALHVGSLAAVIEPGNESVLDLVDQAWQRDAFVSFDPNLRSQFLGDPQQTWRDLEALADRATLVKLSDADIELALPGADPGDVARSLLGETTRLVVVTHGEAGATAYTEHASAQVAAHRVEVADTVGAGDSHMAALLVILFEEGAFSAYGDGLPTEEDRLRELLIGAGQASAVTCSRPGADPPARADLAHRWPHMAES